MISILANFQNGFEGQNNTHIDHTANMSCVVAASFSSLVLLSSSVSTANLSCLLATTFSSLRFLSNSLSSPRFNRVRVTMCCFMFFSRLLIFASYPQPFFPLSSVAETLFALSFPFLIERFFFVHAKAALLAHSRNE